MEKFLKINDNMIIREEDNMIFSAKDMKIYKFNEKGFLIINTIINNNKITVNKLSSLLKDNYTQEEISDLINKMVDNNIVVYEE